ncbi:MAG: ParA family protein [Parcubacteria group bacterium]|nr:ParA family protein [Parcubacteria group bacterium]
MAHTIAIVNQKGGVGKTTTAINLAAYLAIFRKKTLLIDLDSQGNATSGLGVILEGEIANTYHLLIEGRSLSSVVQPTTITNLSLVPASPDVAGAAVELVNQPEREFRLAKVLTDAHASFDTIIIDCPPSLGLLTINGLVAADSVLIPVQCEYYALEGLGQLVRTIELVKTHLKPSLTILGVVLTLFDRRNRLAHQVINEVRKHFPGYVFDAVIPRSIRLAEAPSYGVPIVKHAPWSPGAQAYRNLAQEIMALEKQSNLIGKGAATSATMVADVVKR